MIDETLSPTWDELLVFEEVLVYGRREDIKANPPSVIIEIYDQDKVSSLTIVIIEERTLLSSYKTLYNLLIYLYVYIYLFVYFHLPKIQILSKFLFIC